MQRSHRLSLRLTILCINLKNASHSRWAANFQPYHADGRLISSRTMTYLTHTHERHWGVALVESEGYVHACLPATSGEVRYVCALLGPEPWRLPGHCVLPHATGP